MREQKRKSKNNDSERLGEEVDDGSTRLGQVRSDVLAVLKKRGDHAGRRSEHKAIELGSMPACIPPKQEALFEYMGYRPRLVVQ